MSRPNVDCPHSCQHSGLLNFYQNHLFDSSSYNCGYSQSCNTILLKILPLKQFQRLLRTTQSDFSHDSDPTSGTNSKDLRATRSDFSHNSDPTSGTNFLHHLCLLAYLCCCDQNISKNSFKYILFYGFRAMGSWILGGMRLGRVSL